jgi:transposase
MTSRYELTAAQWRKVEGIRPGKVGDRGRTAVDHRPFVNGVMWVLRSGAHWKHLPARYGTWKSVQRRFTRWAKAGMWERIFAMLMEDPQNPDLLIDSTIVRAHQPAAAGKGGINTRPWGAPAEDGRPTSTWRRMPQAARGAFFSPAGRRTMSRKPPRECEDGNRRR